jgi:hypothetical protein
MDGVTGPNQNLNWQPFGTYQSQTNIAASWSSVGGFSTTTGKIYRVDAACLIIDYHFADLDCSADLAFDLGGGTKIPFLSISASGISGSDVGFYQNRWMAQLTNPIVVFGTFGIFTQSERAGISSASSVWATVSLSQAWPAG